MSTFKHAHARHVAKLELELRLAEIDLDEHKTFCSLPEKNLLTELLEAKVRLALFRVQDYAITNNVPSIRVPSVRD